MSEQRVIVEEIAKKLEALTYELGSEEGPVSDFYINVPIRDVKHAGQIAQKMRKMITAYGADKFLIYG